MGCWNGTCGITQTPIFNGDPVAVFLLIDNAIAAPDESKGDYRLWDSHGHCYPNQYWTPRSIQLYGTYNDYGWFNFEEDWNSEFVLESFQKDLVEMALGMGDDEYSKLETIKEQISSFEGIGTLIHTGNLFVTGHTLISNKKMNRAIGTFAVHRSVFDVIMNNDEDEWDRVMSINKLKQDGKKYIKHIREYIGSDNFTKYRFELYNAPQKNLFNNLFDRTGENQWTSITGAHVLYKEKIQDMILANASDNDFDLIIEELSKYYIFHCSMMALRKTWMPQCGLGSQSENLELHTDVMNAAIAKLDDRQNQYYE